MRKEKDMTTEKRKHLAVRYLKIIKYIKIKTILILVGKIHIP